MSKLERNLIANGFDLQWFIQKVTRNVFDTYTGYFYEDVNLKLMVDNYLKESSDGTYINCLGTLFTEKGDFTFYIHWEQSVSLEGLYEIDLDLCSLEEK